MRDGFSGIGAVEVLQGRVLAAVNRDHAVHRLSCDQTALARIDKNKIGRHLTNVRRNAGARNPRRHAVIRGIFLIRIRVVVLYHFPEFRLVNGSVGAHPAEQRSRTFRLLVIQWTICIPGESRDERTTVKVARQVFTFNRQTVVGDLIWNPEQIIAEAIPYTGQVRMAVRSPRRDASGLRWSIVVTLYLRKLLGKKRRWKEPQCGSRSNDSARRRELHTHLPVCSTLPAASALNL